MIFDEAKRIWDLGGAVHWLHPRQKRPIENAWTTGPRKTWKELKGLYRDGMNVGIRTGEPSKIGLGYLACIDLDVKDPTFKDELLEKLKEVLEGEVCPEVRSGSGNGSRHLYCVTAKPFKMITVLKVKDRGEICVYSDGRQMALPPSVHPNGKLYRWKSELTSAADLPLLDFNRYAEAPSKKKEKGVAADAVDLSGFEISPVDIGWLTISDEMRSAIVYGAGVTDRSGYLLKASSALLSAGLTENEVLTVLTDPDTFLGQCGYDHAQTKSRKKAAEWVYRYTLKRVSAERSASQIFGALPVAKKLTAEELEAQNTDLGEDARKSSDTGYYWVGAKGGRVPDYDGLLNKFKEDHPYKSVADMKTVYVFNGTHYEDITPIEIKAFAEKMFSPKPEDKMRNEFWNKVLVNQVARRRFFIDTTEGKINFKNGILDLNDTVVLQKHSPEVGFRGVLPYDFDPGAECPQFEAWIESVMLGDIALVAILQEFMGYIIRGGDYKYHKALWVGGTGRNGKSTFIDVLKALIGAGNFSTLSIKSLIGDKFASSDLDGKIANFSEETSPEEIADSGPFKNLTGDGDIAAQKKFGDIYSFRNRAKLVMSYNTIPNLKDLSPGMLSRPIIVPFLKNIKEGIQDHGIKKKLFTELSGIFNFALKGWERLEEQNQFTYSEKSVAALEAIKEESCNVFQWVKHYIKCTDDREQIRSVTQLYTCYREREKYPYSLVNFGRKLKGHPELQNHRIRTSESISYWGLEGG